jgi:hypothetical protein
MKAISPVARLNVSIVDYLLLGTEPPQIGPRGSGKVQPGLVLVLD